MHLSTDLKKPVQSLHGLFSAHCPVLNKVYTSHPDFPES